MLAVASAPVTKRSALQMSRIKPARIAILFKNMQITGRKTVGIYIILKTAGGEEYAIWHYSPTNPEAQNNNFSSR